MRYEKNGSKSAIDSPPQSLGCIWMTNQVLPHRGPCTVGSKVGGTPSSTQCNQRAALSSQRTANREPQNAKREMSTGWASSSALVDQQSVKRRKGSIKNYFHYIYTEAQRNCNIHWMADREGLGGRVGLRFCECQYFLCIKFGFILKFCRKMKE